VHNHRTEITYKYARTTRFLTF